MVDVPLVDTAFAHAPGMSWYNVPKHIRWQRTWGGTPNVIFFTDRSLGRVGQFPAKRKVALLIEPPCVDDVGFKLVSERSNEFDYVLTHDRSLLSIDPNKFLLYAIGGCWIPEPDRRLSHAKDAMISIIASSKNSTSGQMLRHQIVNVLRSNMDVYGNGYQPIATKTIALGRYRFSVVVENVRCDDLFTEKIIDCFMTGVIPIYWGTAAISQHFNMGGVLQFESLDQLAEIVKGLSPSVYNSKLDAVKDNFRRAQNYCVAEDWIFEKYPFLMG